MADVMTTSYSELLDRVVGRVRAAATRTFLVGVAGPPASGKSTLAQRLVEDLSDTHGFVARYCPMDGFHFPNAKLDAQGLRVVKGRIDTFDAVALLAAMRRLKAKEAFWWPAYSRELHEPIAEGVRVTGQEEVFVIEGNYLLADMPVWREVAHHFDFRIFIDAPDDVLHQRLLARHHTSGRGADEARAKIIRTDLPNARSIRAGKSTAEVVVDDARCL